VGAPHQNAYARRYQRKLDLAWRTWGIAPHDVELTTEVIEALLLTAPLSG